MFWRVGIARNAVFFRSFVASKVRKGRSEKRGGAEDRVPKISTKFAPRLRARAIWKSKSLKTRRPGALLEVDLDKICTTPACERDWEVKIVKNWRCRSTFGSWHRQNLHHACARERFIYEKKGTTLHVRNTFGSWASQNLHHACARERFGSQNR